MSRLAYLLKLLRGSFWVIPGLMTLAAAALAIGVIWLDSGPLGRLETSWAKSLQVTAESGGRILTVIAGSMITVASLVFSITLLALTLAASNIGPRLIERFMQDRVTQVSLGVFVATFVYSLLVLRAVKGGETAAFVPHLAINFAVLLAILSFGWLVYFIHRISSSIQTDAVVAGTGADFVREIEVYAEGNGEVSRHYARGPFDPASIRTAKYADVRARRSGYIQAIDVSGLFSLAEKHDACIEMRRRPGHFMLSGGVLAHLYSPAGEDAAALAEAAAKHVVLGPTRTALQDVEFLINMVVEVAGRALSPGVNDFYSAIACVDHLCNGLGVVLDKGLPPNLFFDDGHRLRVALLPMSFGDLADAAFNPIRQCAANNVPVSIRLLEAFSMLAPRARSKEDREVLSKHAALVTEAALAAVPQEADRQDIRERSARFQERIAGPPPGPRAVPHG